MPPSILLITGDTIYLNQSSNHWPGNGTQDSPIIIDLSQMIPNEIINIENCDLYLLIENGFFLSTLSGSIYIKNVSNTQFENISLIYTSQQSSEFTMENVSNIQLTNSTFIGPSESLYGTSVNGVIINNCSFFNDQSFVEFDNSNQIFINGCRFENISGITFDNCYQVRIIGNIISNNVYGLKISGNNYFISFNQFIMTSISITNQSSMIYNITQNIFIYDQEPNITLITWIWIIFGITFGIGIISLIILNHHKKLTIFTQPAEININQKILKRSIISGFLIVVAFILFYFPWTIGNIDGIQISVNGWLEISAAGKNSINFYHNDSFISFFNPQSFDTIGFFLILIVWLIILLNDKLDLKMLESNLRNFKIGLWIVIIFIILYDLYWIYLSILQYLGISDETPASLTITSLIFFGIITFITLELPKHGNMIKKVEINGINKIIFLLLNPAFMMGILAIILIFFDMKII